MEQVQRREPFFFTGRGGEYFRIWIVNLCLSLLTLGIYSAWAKVRRMQYFYRHTSVAGANFDYHGDPVAILKGRILAVGLFALYSVAGHFSIVAGLVAFVLIIAVMPWLLVRSFRFRLHNTSYRGLRFSFHGKNGEGYVNFLLLPLVAYMSIGLLWPLAHQQIRRYLHNNSAYGSERFAMHAGPGLFYKPYLVVFGALFVLVIGIVAAAIVLYKSAAPSDDGIALLAMGVFLLIYIAALLLITPYLAARLQNVIWNNTTLGPLGFESRLKARGMFVIMASNFVLIILTLGLFKPFADIRMARYRLENMALQANADLDEFVAGVQVDANAAGEEMAEMFDIDIAL
jgi:uncharacterized membrane protein YjgN (DUF898 family)